MSEYYLMHKDEKCAVLLIDEEWNVTSAVILNSELTPYLGKADEAKMKKWWNMRSIPASRNMIGDFFKNVKYQSPEEYLVKNLALSLTDCYWVCPVGQDFKWNDINMYNMVDINGGKIPYHNNTSYDPNASLGGQMEKYWDLNMEYPQLVKEAYKHYGQQAVNEYFATQIHKLQKTNIPYTTYIINKIENGVECRCENFVKRGYELIPAYEIINSQKYRNDMSLYDAYINICKKNGLEEEIIRNFMDYQTLSDFVITNEDEHWNNFGIIRDTNTLKFVAPAPIYDSGNSMFFKDNLSNSLERHEILEKRITSIHEKEEYMLKHVSNKNLINTELLPSKQYVIDLYTKTGLPEEKATIISENYEKKKEMLLDFQKGRKISYYLEKKKYDHLQKINNIFLNESHKSGPKEFIMTCGLPKTGKTERSEIECEKLIQLGMHKYNATDLYSAKQAFIDTTPFFDRNEIIDKIKKEQSAYDNNGFVVISFNDIRKELFSLEGTIDSSHLGLIADARLIAAFECGYSVIFDAMNLDKNIRKKYIDIANEYNVEEKEIIVINPTKDQIDLEMFREDSYFTPESLLLMLNKLYYNYPSLNDGWTKIIECGEKNIENINDYISVLQNNKTKDNDKKYDCDDYRSDTD